MGKLNWSAPEGRFFDTGLDRGVLYPKGVPPLGSATTNLLLNPSFVSTGNAWVGYWANTSWVASYLANQNTPAGVSQTVLRLTCTPSPQTILWGPSTRPNVVSGKAYSYSYWVKGSMTMSRFSANLNWRDAAGSNIGGINGGEVTIQSGQWTKLTVTGIAPVGAVTSQPFLNTESIGTPGSYFDFAGALFIEASDFTGYFDGDTPDTGKHSYSWTGAAYNSTSLRREVLTKAVPWMGLQSVDEEGGESAAAYYIDGRPFLFLPKPKEFKASLKAITYPDAFSEIMGVQEVADGMYLDSQPGDSFDLSYRTLVGNSTEGIDHGYKIHLVYNCTVAPSGLTYESLSDQINPTSFSWDIQAVPVTVEGFRPTAHIIIDTRHMQQTKIDAVEALLYGSETTVAGMPTPQVIFDLLSFGDTIIVTDNGDGTFDVTGSYENVYMIEDGIFRVDNVDGQDNGDGTFTISTTGE